MPKSSESLAEGGLPWCFRCRMGWPRSQSVREESSAGFVEAQRSTDLTSSTDLSPSAGLSTSDAHLNRADSILQR